MSQEQFEYEVMREEYEELPPHKRPGYGERMMEWAEDIFDRTKEPSCND